MAIVLVIWILVAGVAMVVGNEKGKPGAGLMLGLVLGPLGVIVAALLEPTPAIAAARQAKIDAATEQARRARDEPSS